MGLQFADQRDIPIAGASIRPGHPPVLLEILPTIGDSHETGAAARKGGPDTGIVGA